MMSPEWANSELSALIKDGVQIEFENTQGRTEPIRVKVIDFDTVSNNEFLVVT